MPLSVRNTFVVIMLFFAGFMMTACSEVQYASHLSKKIFPPTKSEGTFKVGTPYKIEGKRYIPQESYTLVETGIASWYGPQFHGKQTANGEIFDMYELTAAHRTLQMPSLVRVTNLENGRSLIVRVNDRGPFARGRIIDLSKRSAELLGFKNQGTAKVRLEVLKQESLQIAEVAKRGESTRGFEVALNRGERMPGTVYDQRNVQVASLDASDQASSPGFQKAVAHAAPPQPVEREVLMTNTSSTGIQNAIPGHIKNGHFYPDPIVTEMPVTKTNIYVQAGSFSVQDNARNLAARMASLGSTNVYPATVNGRSFYRVRVGPVSNVEEADKILNQLVASGNQSAMIVVD